MRSTGILGFVAIETGAFVRIDPPSVEKAERVSRYGLRPAKHIPIRDRVGAAVPLRDDVLVPQKNTIQCPRRCRQTLAVLRAGEPLDQVIDNRVFDAGVIVAAGLVGKVRIPEPSLPNTWGSPKHQTQPS